LVFIDVLIIIAAIFVVLESGSALMRERKAAAGLVSTPAE
jgi:hypothetical protein